MKYQNAIVLFRRDLRLLDNTAFNHAAQNAQSVLPLFIFDPRQVTAKNTYLSKKSLHFMVQSLEALDQNLRKQGGFLYCARGVAEKVISAILSQGLFKAVFCNRDYTPFSKKRDLAIEQACKRQGVDFFSFDDVLLIDPDAVKTGDNRAYALFTPFYKKAQALPVPKAKTKRCQEFYGKKLHHTATLASLSALFLLPDHAAADLAIVGGSDRAQGILKNIDFFTNYQKTRDQPDHPTTLLSAHLKFGTVSVRQVYHAIVNKLGPKHELIRQLFFRDFFTYVVHHAPRVLEGPFRTEFSGISWKQNEKLFSAWCMGKTGFPIIDAGMRQLNETGFMHNRVRMITASFLVKNCLIDWREGERYFAQHLIDYDPSINNGNWQWVAGTGCDAQPYFRIFNPWRQQKKFDPNCHYIKTWVKELQNISPTLIHSWHARDAQDIPTYVRPILDIQSSSQVAIQAYKEAALQGRADR